MTLNAPRLWTIARAIPPGEARADLALTARLLSAWLTPALRRLLDPEAPSEPAEPSLAELGQTGPMLTLELDAPDGSRQTLQAARDHPGELLGRAFDAELKGRAVRDPEGRAAALELAASLEPLSAPELLGFGALLETVLAVQQGDQDASARLSLLASNPSPNPINRLGRLALAEPGPVEHQHAGLALLFALALADYGLAERCWAALQGGCSAALGARVALILASARLEREHHAGYLSLIEKARALSPEDPAVDRQWAVCSLLQGRWQDALAAWDRVIAARHPAAPALLGRGRALCGLERWIEAAGTLQEALRFDPDASLTEAIVEQLGEALSLASRHAELLALAERYGEAFEATPTLARALATAWLLSGQQARAEAALTELIERGPQEAVSHALLARARSARGHSAKAIEPARRAAELEPERRLWKVTLADCLVEAEQHAEAAQIFAELSEEAPVNSGVYMVLMARAHEQKGDTESARSWYRTACEAYGDQAFVKSEFGAFLVTRGEPAEAAQLLAPLLDSHPEYRPGLENLQSALMQLLRESLRHPRERVDGWKARMLRVNERLSELDSSAPST